LTVGLVDLNTAGTDSAQALAFMELEGLGYVVRVCLPSANERPRSILDA
jgi:hypothetical protein